ncbi:MAG: hypothetical protein KJP06_00170 [Deltaproteobacteria bacterium]|nr:hypothetical protein [Deltaproteobacteria bacterium]
MALRKHKKKILHLITPMGGEVDKMKVKYSIIIAITILLMTSPAISQPLKIATWNIENLRDSNNEEPNRRNQINYDRLAGCATQLDADIIALLWCSDKLIHLRSDKLRRSSTQQRKDGLVISRLLPRP